MNYKFTLTTESMLLAGSGEGGVLIDADVVFHPTGFPYIPAKRVKGMLRESTEEVLEIYGKNEADIKKTLDALFGVPGRSTYEGKLTFKNLYVQDWINIIDTLEHIPNVNAFQPDFIKSFFTTEVQQTAIGEDGVAQNRSLRNYRVINPGWTFETTFHITEALTDIEWNLLQKAVQNLLYAGTRRNRGFGKIKCQIAEVNEEETQTANNPSNNENIVKIEVDVTTIAPVVLAQQLGEQNTVFTLKHITGNHLRGLLANAFIRNHGLVRENAHLNGMFYDIFLSGKLHFSDLTYKNSRPIPLHVHAFKCDKNQNPVSVFSRPIEITKSLAGQGIIEDGVIYTEGYTPKTTFNFHNSRENRAAGRNTEHDNEGGIFYYESLNEGQTFIGEITGETSLLNSLVAAFEPTFTARLGRSKAAQYGEVHVALTPQEQDREATTQSYPIGQYILTLISPLVLLNENGMPSPDKNSLLNALPEGIEILNAAASTTTLEQFNATWQSKSGKYNAYKEGSSFLLELKSELSEPITQLGEWKEQGFGRVRFEPFDENQRYEIHPKNGNTPSVLQEGGNTKIPILDEIYMMYLEEQKKVGAKTKAIEDAGKPIKTLKNHQIGRLERLFENSTTEEEINEWIENTRNKPTGDALKNARLIDEGHRFRIERHGISDFPLLRVYWITYFQTLRKKNKANG
jgi:CRISPR-associated protein Csx10